MSHVESGGIKKALRHVIPTIKQWWHGKTIGERKTPVVSVWPMRPKWEKYERVFTCYGRDGDWDIRNGVLRQPPEIQLVYVKFRGNVIQLAYLTGRIAV